MKNNSELMSRSFNNRAYFLDRIVTMIECEAEGPGEANEDQQNE